MSLWTHPALWWRAAIVLAAGTGLALETSSLVYFTVDSNVIVFGYFIGAVYWMVQRGTTEAPAPRLRGAAVLYITITGLVAHFTLNEMANPLPGLVSGTDRLEHWALFLVHYVTPVMVLLDWVLLRPRNSARWRDVPLWLSFPLGYAALVLVRAALLPDFVTPYPYFFLDPTTNGYGWVAGQVALMTVEFALIAAAVVGLDRLGNVVVGRLRPARV